MARRAARGRWRGLLRQTQHRPWPLPRRPWLMTMSWQDLLFAHWPVPADLLRPHVPEDLALDRHGGSAWLTVACFRMEQTGLRGGLRVPGHSRFPELNVRTYVTADGKPGVWFFALDATSRLAVAAGRALGLPYRHAHMAMGVDGRHWFRSRRADGSAAVAASYRPTGHAVTAPEGSLSEWLTERYCLYAARRGRLRRQQVHHLRWPLHPAESAIEARGLAPFAPGALDGPPRLTTFTPRLDVVAWAPERLP